MCIFVRVCSGMFLVVFSAPLSSATSSHMVQMCSPELTPAQRHIKTNMHHQLNMEQGNSCSISATGAATASNIPSLCLYAKQKTWWAQCSLLLHQTHCCIIELYCLVCTVGTLISTWHTATLFIVVLDDITATFNEISGHKWPWRDKSNRLLRAT